METNGNQGEHQGKTKGKPMGNQGKPMEETRETAKGNQWKTKGRTKGNQRKPRENKGKTNGNQGNQWKPAPCSALESLNLWALALGQALVPRGLEQPSELGLGWFLEASGSHPSLGWAGSSRPRAAIRALARLVPRGPEQTSQVCVGGGGVFCFFPTENK